MTLQMLASIAEEGPWCGTRPPGRPPRPGHLTSPSTEIRSDQLGGLTAGPWPVPWFLSQLINALGANMGPSPHPWITGEVEAGLYAAISLHQLAQRASGGDAERISSAAERVFDDTCGSIPISVLIWILLHRPPPPPPPWLQQITFLTEVTGLIQGVSQAEALGQAAKSRLGESLQNLGLNSRTA